MMLRSATVLAFLLSSVPAFGETAPERSLEEAIAVSSAIVIGKVTKMGDEVRDGAFRYRKFEVRVDEVVRAAADGPKKDAAVNAFAATPPKEGEERIFFLGGNTTNGHRLHLSTPKANLPRVKVLLELDGNAAKELEGKERLRAAFFRANQLRPVLRAAAENRELKAGDAVTEAERDKLLVILASALQEANRADAAADVRRLAESLLKVLSGPGGLPEFATRNERITQFWARQLAAQAERKKLLLTKLIVADKAPPAGEGAPVQRVVNQRVAVLVQPSSEGRPPESATPASARRVVAPPDSALGQPVGGLRLSLRTDRASYEFGADTKAVVQLTATLRNDGLRAVRVNLYTVFPLLADVYITDPGGRLALYADEGRLDAGTMPAMGAWSFKELRAGESVELATRVPASRFPRAGQYAVCLTYRNAYGKQFGIANAWTGEVTSERVSVQVGRGEGARGAAPDPELVLEPTRDARLRGTAGETDMNGGASPRLRLAGVNRTCPEFALVDFDRAAITRFLEKHKDRKIECRLVLCVRQVLDGPADVQAAVLDSAADWTEGRKIGEKAEKGECNYLFAQADVKPWCGTDGKPVGCFRDLIYDAEKAEFKVKLNSTSVSVSEESGTAELALDEAFVRRLGGSNCRGLVLLIDHVGAKLDFFSREERAKAPQLIITAW